MALPRVTDDLPGTGGTIRETAEDFLVEEVPAYPPSGTGDHTFLFVEKVDLTTAEMVRRVAAALGADPGAAGVAGQKDRHARTRQWISLEKVDPDRARGLEVEGARVLEAARHGHKLRTGHLRANRFEIRLRGVVPGALALAQPIVDRLVARGVPGYFGPQRFGRDGRGAEIARAWLSGASRPPKDRGARKLGASAWQSALFNEVCARRVAGGWLRALDGDVARKEETGGMFVEPDASVLQPRIDSGEVSPTGPLYGEKMREPSGDAAALEASVLATDPRAAEILSRWPAILPGGRRPLRHFPTDVRLREEPDGLVLAFTLPSGAYATILCGEVTKID